jgi:molybdenum-dependent DNA-binding transcriptional regulator ModE
LYDRCSSITLRHLQIFSAVSRQRSFARAADGLCLSQPAVSTQIKELETILGVRLLVRSRGRRQIDLTPAGEVLLASCAEISETLERTEKALGALREFEQGTVTFGASLYFGAYILPGVHTALQRLGSSMPSWPSARARCRRWDPRGMLVPGAGRERPTGADWRDALGPQSSAPPPHLRGRPPDSDGRHGVSPVRPARPRLLCGSCPSARRFPSSFL